MKKAILILIALCSTYIYSQGTEPTFEADGDMVKATYFHDNGEIAQIGFMLNGKLHGNWTMFNAEGTKVASGKYIDGKRQGIWYFYEGDMVKEVEFVDNKIAAVRDWNASDGVTVN